MSPPEPKTRTIFKDEMDHNGILGPVAYEDPIPAVQRKPDIRCYILVNSQLPTIHGGIQSAHALSELVHYNQNISIVKDWVENHKTIVLLSANLEQMSQMKVYFDSKNRKFASFLEPDLDNIETAIAFEPMDVLEGKILFSRFKLYN